MMQGSPSAEREALIERAVTAAEKCHGGSVSNPRYFVEMLTGCAAGGWADERIALEELAEALERIARRQALQRAQEAALWAAAEIQRMQS